ncbi:Pentapeptide repeat-containing protein [Sinosporangium album]|uniref:Pentapeptide repeat-containing protein n=1 Tax=Sinosporangium album TaxID=504805 RepID=A0A1G7ZSE5_9ACTN|nr:pentapeptide repeat-containing protein [Sinosporangium album]SDH11547.1 Pentapeptide repeat-containing protein [Sinosporangium album]
MENTRTVRRTHVTLPDLDDADLDEVRLHSVEFSGCDLSGLRWTGGKLSRTVFTGCKLLGAVWEEVVLEDVLFERCRLDMTVFTRLRATGPVVFTSCSLREATFTAADLSSSVAGTSRRSALPWAVPRNSTTRTQTCPPLRRRGTSTGLPAHPLGARPGVHRTHGDPSARRLHQRCPGMATRRLLAGLKSAQSQHRC